MPFANPKGRDWSSVVNWDGLGKIYAAFAITWTVLLCVCIGWLIRHRNLYYIKFRNIWLAIAATFFLHIYLIKILLAYTTNGHFNCLAEFWIMSIYLPFGIAFFQANMAQLRSVSDQQKRTLLSLSSDDFRDEIQFANNKSDLKVYRSESEVTESQWAYGGLGENQLTLKEPAQREGSGIPIVRRASHPLYGFRHSWARISSLQQTQLLIAAGMLAQVIITLGVFLASRKFHSSWGVTGPYHELSAANCRKGWEWIPSAFWQLVWTWLLGPYTLIKIRNIKDVHYWKTTTVICILAGLPGTPLWLAALYLPSLEPVNKLWVPPMWLAPGIVVMQLCTVVVPIFEAYRYPHYPRSLPGSTASWIGKRTSSDQVSSSATSTYPSERNSKDTSPSTINSYKRRDIYSMAALDKTLAVNAAPLLHFAATRDFTGENIVFLLQLRQWHTAWNQLRGSEDRRHLFHLATDIFNNTINPKTAEFPINISSSERKKLEYLLFSEMSTLQNSPKHSDATTNEATTSKKNLVDPFNSPVVFASNSFDVAEPDSPSLASIGRSTSEPDSIRSIHGHRLSQQRSSQTYNIFRNSNSDTIPPLPQLPNGARGQCSACDATANEIVVIPDEFDEHVFDAVEQSIKITVVTNTWPRFINTHKEERASKAQ